MSRLDMFWVFFTSLEEISETILYKLYRVRFALLFNLKFKADVISSFLLEVMRYHALRGLLMSFLGGDDQCLGNN